MNKFITIGILLIIAVILSSYDKNNVTHQLKDNIYKKENIRNKLLRNLKESNVEELNKESEHNEDVIVSGDVRFTSNPDKHKDFLIIPENQYMNSRNNGNDKYKDILKEWNGVIDN